MSFSLSAVDIDSSLSGSRIKAAKREFIILYSFPTWAFIYENKSSSLIPLEWEYSKLGS